MDDSVKLAHFRNLISAAAADGKIDEAERASLIRIATSMGIPSDRLAVMLQHAHEYISLIPQTKDNREKQLEDMISIALVDGVFAESERQLIRVVARKLGFTEEETDRYLQQARANDDSGIR